MPNELVNLVLPVVRIKNMDIWETSTFEGEKTDKYQLLAIFDKTRKEEFKALQTAVLQAAKERWGDKLKGVGVPFGDGDEKTEEWGDIMEGMTYLRCSTYQQPHVIDQHGNVIVDQKDLYSGCHVQLIVRTRILDKYGKKQVLLTLLAIKKIKDDDPLGSTYNMEQALADFGIDAPMSSEDTGGEGGGGLDFDM